MRAIPALLTLPLNLLSAFTGWRVFETWAFTLLCVSGAQPEAVQLAASMLENAENEAGAEYFRDHVVPESIRAEAWASFREASAA